MTQTLAPQPPSRWRQAFLIALGIGALLFLPFIIRDGGYFIYYGDFNVQQIPFYKLAHEAVRSGDLWWSWYTDLGANFIGSYSFYLLFSPFFWLTLPFPTSAVPYLMGPLLMLKMAFAGATACLYLERFVRDRAFAVLGALLYAFSGWMFFGVFFNHFLEVAVFFPLLLLGVEQLVLEDRKCFFALMVALNAMVNYWFFVGEAIFVVLYVLLRMTDPGFPMRPGKFLRLSLEAVLGLGLAMAVVLPSVLAILGNPRTGTDELLTGWSFWLYGHEQRQPAIIQSLFFPPELPARPNFLPDHGAKWSSLSAWLPLVGMTGVLAYFFQRQRDWLKKLLALCLVIALVPGLNSLFILLNNSYYARWFYMPVLLMCLATIQALEYSAKTTEHMLRGIKWSLIIVSIFVVMSGVTPNFVDGQLQFGMYKYPRTFWVFSIIAVVSLLALAVLLVYFRHSRRFVLLLGSSVSLLCVLFGLFYLDTGKYTATRAQTLINTAIRGREYISLPQEPFSRIDVYDGTDNLGMFWGLPTIQAFHSIVPPSVMEFYPNVGVKRDVGSRPEAEYYALRPLLSVRWLFIEAKKEEQHPMPGYTKYAEQVGYSIYENDNFIPMGFGYQCYVTREQMEFIAVEDRSNLMLRAIVLEEEDAALGSGILVNLATDVHLSFEPEDMEADALARREMAADSFQRDNRGFTARSSLPEETILFFSVPWEEGWSATVNGTPAQILRVNVGFMGVHIPAGEVEVRFDYHTPGLRAGLWISGGALMLWLAYLLLAKRLDRRRPAPAPVTGESPLDPRTLSWEDYVKLHNERGLRAARLQRTLNEAASRFVPPSLEPEEQTLPFKAGEDDHTTDEEREGGGTDA